MKPGMRPLDVEIADLAETEERLVIARPLVHAAAMDIVGEMVDLEKPDALRRRIGAGQRQEIDVVDGAVAIAVDEIDEAAADPLDRRNVELHRTDLALDALGAQRQRAGIGLGGVADAERHGADRGTVQAREGLGEALRLGIDQEIDLALAVERHVLGAVARHGGETHALEDAPQIRRVGRGVFDELEPVRSHGVGRSTTGGHRNALLSGDNWA